MTSTPQTPELDSQTYSSPLSYVGATRRIVGFGQRVHQDGPMNIVVQTGVGVFLTLAYVVVTLYYLLVVLNIALAASLVAVGASLVPAFGLGLFILAPATGYLVLSLAPFGFRSHRRAQRKAQHVQEAHLAATQELLRKNQEH